MDVCTEERCCRVYWEKDADDGAARKEKRGRSKRRFMDAVREDMTAVEVTEEDVEERTEWRRRNRYGDPKWEQPKDEEYAVWVGM